MAREVDRAPAARITTARDIAEQELRMMIIDGHLSPGDRINEVALAEQLGISRGPIREAVQTLISEQLLTQVRNKGAFVSVVDAGELCDLYDVRIAVESRAVYLVAQRRSPDQIAELVRLLDETVAAIKSEGTGAYPSDLDFHRAIVLMTANDVLYRFGLEVQTRIQLARARSQRDPVRALQALEEHREIVQLMIDGDSYNAALHMETHLWRSFDNAVVHLS